MKRKTELDHLFEMADDPEAASFHKWALTCVITAGAFIAAVLVWFAVNMRDRIPTGFEQWQAFLFTIGFITVWTIVLLLYVKRIMK